MQHSHIETIQLFRQNCASGNNVGMRHQAKFSVCISALERSWSEPQAEEDAPAFCSSLTHVLKTGVQSTEKSANWSAAQTCASWPPTEHTHEHTHTRGVQFMWQLLQYILSFHLSTLSLSLPAACLCSLYFFCFVHPFISNFSHHLFPLCSSPLRHKAIPACATVHQLALQVENSPQCHWGLILTSHTEFSAFFTSSNFISFTVLQYKAVSFIQSRCNLWIKGEHKCDTLALQYAYFTELSPSNY